MTASDVYLDSNFVIKLYQQEAESRWAWSALAAVKGEAVVSDLTDVEVTSVLTRNLSVVDANKSVRKYQAQRQTGLYGYVPCNAEVFAYAARLAELYAKAYLLRSLDLLHLSATIGNGIPTIATFDKRLRAAAQALGLAVLPA